MGKKIHIIRIGLPDLQVMEQILAVYAQGVRTIHLLLPMRDAYLSRINELRERIAILRTEPVKNAIQDFPLTHREQDLIGCAFTVFIAAVRECVPPSKERNEVLRGCRGLQAYILSGAPPHD